MNILEVIPYFAPIHGGSAEASYQLSKELSRRQHQVTIYTSDNKLGLEYINSIPDVKVRAFKTWLSWMNFYVTPGMITQIREELKSFNAVHLHNYRTFQNNVAHYFCRKSGIPYVLQAHGSLARIISRKSLKYTYDSIWGRRLLRDASKVIAVTEFEAEQYKDNGVAENKIVIIPHGISHEEFSNLPQKGKFRSTSGISDDEKVILWLGRIDRTKGLDILIQAFSELAGTLPHIRLVITGPDDGYLTALRQLINIQKIDKSVIFTGPLYGRDKLTAYVDADVFVLPSYYEIFGITVLEALACGTPVVVTDRCGIAETVRGKAGLVISYDVGQLKNALLQVLENDVLRDDYSKKGKKLVLEKFDWKRVTQQIEKLYEEVL